MVTSCGCPDCNVSQVNDEVKAVIKVGQKVYFDPFSEITGFSSELNRGNFVTGTVVYVNYPHKWFSIEFGNPKARTSFKFCQLGKDVRLSK